MRAVFASVVLLACSDPTVTSSYPDMEPPRPLVLHQDYGKDFAVDVFVHQWTPPAQQDEGVVDLGPDAECSPSSRKDCVVSEDLLGECARGVQVCSLGSWGQCTPIRGQRGEVCDGLDNDCDGFEDENSQGQTGTLSLACYEGPNTSSKHGACRPGVRLCLEILPDQYGYSEECSGQVLPGAEICDGVDNDCNGVTDDLPFLGDVCLAEGNPAGVGECVAGILGCSALDPQLVCMGEVEPLPELCDDLDNDCDGSVDENLGRCDCENPLFVPRPETCNGVDDDCDGIIDNEGNGLNVRLSTMCYTNLEGILVPVENAEDFPPMSPPCLGGRALCEQNAEGDSGYFQCVGEIRPGRERCNGLDDDCDGSADEGFSDGTAVVVFGIDISGSMEPHEIATAVEVADRALLRLAANNNICYIVAIIGRANEPILVDPALGCVPADGNGGVNARAALQRVSAEDWPNRGRNEGSWDLIYDSAVDDRDTDQDGIPENVLWRHDPNDLTVGVDIDLSHLDHRIVIIIGDERGQTNRGLTQEDVAAQVVASGTLVYVISPYDSIIGAVDTIQPSYAQLFPQVGGECSSSPNRGYCDYFYPIVRGRDQVAQVAEIAAAMGEVMGDLACYEEEDREGQNNEGGGDP